MLDVCCTAEAPPVPATMAIMRREAGVAQW
jgi:hypothetical protein